MVSLPSVIDIYKHERYCYSINDYQYILFFILGLKMTVVLLDKLSTYTCRITRTRTAIVPDDIANMKSMRGVLYMAWSAKMLVQEALKLL